MLFLLSMTSLGGGDGIVRKRALAASAGKLFWDVSSRSLSLLLAIVLARTLGAEGYGRFAVLWYTAWMLAQATDLGLHLTGLRRLSRQFRARTLHGILAAKAVLSGLAILAIAGLFLARAPGALPLALLLFVQLAGSWVELGGVVLRSRGAIAREGMLLVVLRSSWLAASGMALWQSTDLRQVAACLAVFSLPALLIAAPVFATASAREAPSTREEPDPLAWDVLPLAITSVVTLVYLRADLLILAALRTSVEVGLFAASFRLFEATFVVSGAIVAGAFPLLVRAVGDGTHVALARLLGTWLLGAALPIGTVFVAFAGPTLHAVYGGEFQDAAPVLAILGLAIPAVYVNALTTHWLIATGRAHRLVAAILVRLTVGLLLDVLWIPEHGASGAAMAVCAAEWSLTAVSLAFALERLPRPVPISPKEGILSPTDV